MAGVFGDISFERSSRVVLLYAVTRGSAVLILAGVVECAMCGCLGGLPEYSALSALG